MKASQLIFDLVALIALDGDRDVMISLESGPVLEIDTVVYASHCIYLRDPEK